MGIAIFQMAALLDEGAIGDRRMAIFEANDPLVILIVKLSPEAIAEGDRFWVSKSEFCTQRAGNPGFATHNENCW